jgi:hypothetical protein
MSFRAPTRGDHIMLGYRCGRCLVDNGEWCRTERGSRAAMLHAPRFYAAQATGEFPIDADEKGD